MRGLLLKDWYLTLKYCRSLLLISVVFLGASVFAESNQFFILYPFLFNALVPITLYSYDEREHFLPYCAGLPVSRAQYVSGKYVLGLICIAGIVVLTVLVRCAALAAGLYTEFSQVWAYLPLLLGFSFIAPSIVLPMMFWLGAEKGRIAYYLTVGAVCGVGVVAAGSISIGQTGNYQISGLPVLLAGAAIYALSWVLGIALYKKREL